ncbi:MAG: conjugal transfer protein TraG N-terminal domain-containing protein [Colwellia sp.]|jgi:TraG-like protein, N-terminal region.
MKTLLLLLISILPAHAFADAEFHSFGGFSTVVNGFTYMRDVFGGSNYGYIIFAIIIVAVLFTAIVNSVKGLTGKAKGQDVLAALFFIVFGFTVYKATIVPTTTLHIYDEVLNKYQTVDNVPMLIAHAAQAVNGLERLATSAFSSLSVSRTRHGGGATIQLLSNILDSDPIKHDEYLSKTIDAFFKNCLPPARASTTGTYGTFNEEKILNGSSSLITELAKLKSKFVTTLNFDSSNKIGSNTTCWNAWDSITIRLNTATAFDQHYMDNCEKIGFSEVADLPVCKARIQEISAHIMDGSGLTLDTSTLAKNQALAQRYFHNLSSRPSAYLSNIIDAKQQEGGLSALVAANQWLPTVRYSTMMIIIGIMPFLVLMFFTPMLGKALKYVFGLLLFVAIWGVCDAAIHGITMGNVQEQLASMATTKYSVYTFMTAPSELQKAIATLGKMQSMGLILSGLLMSVFFGISGHAFANMGEKLQQDIDRSGGEAGRDVFDPNARQRTTDGYSESQAKSREMQNMGTERYMNAHGDNTVKPTMIQDNYYQDMAANGYTDNEAFYSQTAQSGGAEAGRVSMTDNIGRQTGGSGADVSQRLASMSTQQNYENVESTDGAREQIAGETGLNNIDHLTNQNVAGGRSAQANYNVQGSIAEQNNSTPIGALEESTEASMADSVARHIALEEIQDMAGRDSILSAAENQATMGMRMTLDQGDLERMQAENYPINPQSIEDAKEGPVVATVTTDVNSNPVQVDTDTGSGAKHDTRVQRQQGYEVTKGALDSNPQLEDSMIQSALQGNKDVQLQLADQYDAETFISLSESDLDSRNLSYMMQGGTPSWLPVSASTTSSGTTTDQDIASVSERDMYAGMLGAYSDAYVKAGSAFERDNIQAEFEEAKDMLQDAARNRSENLTEDLAGSTKNPGTPDAVSALSEYLKGMYIPM